MPEEPQQRRGEGPALTVASVNTWVEREPPPLRRPRAAGPTIWPPAIPQPPSSFDRSIGSGWAPMAPFCPTSVRLFGETAALRTPRGHVGPSQARDEDRTQAVQLSSDGAATAAASRRRVGVLCERTGGLLSWSSRLDGPFRRLGASSWVLLARRPTQRRSPGLPAVRPGHIGRRALPRLVERLDSRHPSSAVPSLSSVLHRRMKFGEVP
jgi:hypothetical protein